MTLLQQQYEIVLAECKRILSEAIECLHGRDTSGARHWFRELNALANTWLHNIIQLRQSLYDNNYSFVCEDTDLYIGIFHRMIVDSQNHLVVLEAIES